MKQQYKNQFVVGQHPNTEEQQQVADIKKITVNSRERKMYQTEHLGDF